MKTEDLTREQTVTILLIIGVLFGLLVLPVMLQHLYSIDAITVAFTIIIIYALLNWYMKNQS